MTIKARLALAFVVLLVGSTIVVGFVLVTTTRSSLTNQVDNRLRDSRERPGPQGGQLGNGDTNEQHFVAVAELIYSSDGSLTDSQAAGFTDDPLSLPSVPSLGHGRGESLVGHIITRPARDGSFDYHVLIDHTREGDYRVLAAPLLDVDQAVSSLVKTLVVTSVAVVLLGAGVAWWIVRRGLRPVDGMIDTAGAIAAGDLSQRIDHPDDRTELGRLATALDDMLSQLETSIAEREASKARLEQFVGDASHELRTPVTAIRGYAELYRNGGLQSHEELDRAMTRIEGESTRMGRLVDDLLLLARLDEHQPLEVADVDLTQLASDAVSDSHAVDTAHPVRLDAPQQVHVQGDERRLRQVITNLLANARVHTPSGTNVTVSVAQNGTGALLTVSDDGPGIAEADRRRIFERFYRADRSRSRAKGGTGLGLSIVAAVVEAHGGTVDVLSEPGHGTRFVVRLPRGSS